MDNSNYPSRNRHSEHLGVNKIGKNIRKIGTFVDPARPADSQPPQVYNINKNDFRNIVQQLTGSPSHHSQQPFPVPVPVPVPVPGPPLNPPGTRLQRICPPRLSPIDVTRPRLPVQVLPNTAESPISAYMGHLQHSINDSRNQQTQAAGLLPNPHGPPPPFPSPRTTSGLPPLLPLPYPLLSPGYQQHPPPLTPNFPFSPGILGPGPQPPGVSFPLSPGFFSVLSPRWRD